MRITFAANAGVLVEAGGARFLVDGLHHTPGLPFSMVPDELLERMNTQENQFRNVDYLVFTHAHPDHYTPDTVLDYVRHNRVGRVFLPAAGGAEHDRLVSWLRERQVPTRILEHDMEKPHTYFLKKELYLTAAGVPHMKTSWPDSVCNCVVLTACGENAVFLSDCDLQSEAYYSFLKAAHITAAFVNPYFFHDCAGRKILQEIIAPDCLFIYHMPFANEDKTGLRGLVRQDMKKYGDSFARIEVLVEQEQTVWVGE